MDLKPLIVDNYWWVLSLLVLVWLYYRVGRIVILYLAHHTPLMWYDAKHYRRMVWLWPLALVWSIL